MNDTEMEFSMSIVSSPSLAGKMEQQAPSAKGGRVGQAAKAGTDKQPVPTLEFSSKVQKPYQQDPTSEDQMSCDIRSFTNTSK